MGAFARSAHSAGRKRRRRRSNDCSSAILRACTPSRCGPGWRPFAMQRPDISLLVALVAYSSAGCYADDVLATRIQSAGGEGQGCGDARIEAPSNACPALPVPTGPIVCVGPDQTAALPELVAAAVSGTT